MSIDLTIAAVGDPNRRELLRRLARRPYRAGDLAEGFKISRPAVFKHARLLRRAGLVEVKKAGRERLYQLAPGGHARIQELIKRLEQVGQFWDVALHAFKRYAEEQT
ncbi:MAG TPA: winged helix-turn-helix domain-containing protein [Candidatus Binataceae bacterium]|nr:winged helix-turn-helix domain-containing protein [Candidatus Binataceae bacterium]